MERMFPNYLPYQLGYIIPVHLGVRQLFRKTIEFRMSSLIKENLLKKESTMPLGDMSLPVFFKSTMN